MTRTRWAVVAGALTLALVGFGAGRATAPDPAPAAVADQLVGRAPGAPGPVEIGFAQDMAVHHEQAVLMATLATSRGGVAVRGIAGSILTLQSQEVGLMRGWLRLWDAPGASATPMAWMGEEHGADHATMPGMATPTQLDRLYRLRGDRFDRLFLALMSRHHRGGIAMAHAAVEGAELPVVRTAAQTMISEQVEDLATMGSLAQSLR